MADMFSGSDATHIKIVNQRDKTKTKQTYFYFKPSFISIGKHKMHAHFVLPFHRRFSDNELLYCFDHAHRRKCNAFTDKITRQSMYYV